MTTEKRNSYRCPNFDEGQKAVIRVGRRTIVVELMNQSAGGFSVTAPRRLRIRPGQVLLMRTAAGWFQAQVIHKQIRDGRT
ncbi:MAG: hypothetical protein WD070_09720, partial [Pirellulaceae bacterium]